eukprot:1358424-Rhodomonas_salina.1
MQHSYAFQATVQAPEPKHQTEALSLPDTQDWIASEWVEMDTIYRMGTIIYIKNCNLPQGTTTIPTKFAYKTKFGDQGQEIKKLGGTWRLAERIRVHQDVCTNVTLQHHSNIDLSGS